MFYILTLTTGYLEDCADEVKAVYQECDTHVFKCGNMEIDKKERSPI